MKRVFYSEDYELIVRQKPVAAKVFIGKEKGMRTLNIDWLMSNSWSDRKPVDPPPIIQLRVSESIDPSQNYLQSTPPPPKKMLCCANDYKFKGPYFFVSCSLLDDDETRLQAEREQIKHGLAGTLVSSLHRLKDIDNTDGGFFVFGDLSVKVEGTLRLQFTLYEVRDKEVAYIKSVASEPFNVYASKNWPGMAESTILTRSFSDQGVRLRLRKEPRSRLGARGPASDNYEPRRYKIQNRRQSQTESHHPQQLQQTYHWAQEGMGDQGLAPVDYSARQPKQQLPSPSPVSLTYQRKREYSNSSQSGSYASHGEESFSKRARRDSEYTHQQTYGMQQYSSSPDYGGRLKPLPTQAIGLAYPSSPHALYSSGYSSNPLPITHREQSNYSTPRRADTHFPSVSAYELSGSRVSNIAPQRFPLAYDYTNPFQPSSQSFSNLQPPQSQFISQLAQPVPPSKATTGMLVYNMQLESEQTSMLPRPNVPTPSEMQPPAFGRTMGPGVGTPHSGSMLLPSMGEELKHSRTSMFDTRPRNNNANH